MEFMRCNDCHKFFMIDKPGEQADCSFCKSLNIQSVSSSSLENEVRFELDSDKNPS